MGLGPAHYRVFLGERGGRVIAEMPWRQLTWGRVLDDMSSASATIPASHLNSHQSWALGLVEPWHHELHIHRNGETVWIGILAEPVWEGDSATIAARDLFQWFERRILPHNRDYHGMDLAQIFAVYAQDALEGDRSPKIGVATTLCGVVGDRKVLASEQAYAADKMRELSRTGVDFTCIGRRLLVGGEEVPIAKLPPMTSDNFVDPGPAIRGAGLLTASETRVLGSSMATAGEPIVGIAGGVGHLTGLVQRTFSESDIADTPSANRAARTRWDVLHGTPLYVSGQLVARRAPPVSRLVPGAVCPLDVRANVKHLKATMRLAAVSVSADTNSGISESFGVTFIPLGTTQEAA